MRRDERHLDLGHLVDTPPDGQPVAHFEAGGRTALEIDGVVRTVTNTKRQLAGVGRQRQGARQYEAAEDERQSVDRSSNSHGLPQSSSPFG